LKQKIGDNAYEINEPIESYRPVVCNIGNAVIFDGFQPHASIVSEKIKGVTDLRIAFSYRYELLDDLNFIASGLTNNYKTSVIKDTDYNEEDLADDGKTYNSYSLFNT
jgi:hypothetical protein